MHQREQPEKRPGGSRDIGAPPLSVGPSVAASESGKRSGSQSERQWVDTGPSGHRRAFTKGL